jgi:hypothetical protein
MYAFAKDAPPDREAIAARFARMPDDRLRSPLASARLLIAREQAGDVGRSGGTGGSGN